MGEAAVPSSEGQPIIDSRKHSITLEADASFQTFSPASLKPIGHPSPTGSVCHGIVQNLEAKVPSSWWKTLFADNMYLKTDGDVVEDPEITSEEIALLESDADILEILTRGDSSESSSSVLDLCCGQGRHVLALHQKYPLLHLHGHDQSSFLISVAKERKLKQNPDSKLPFTVGDCREIPYADTSFDLILVMGNSFGYFPDDHGDKSVLNEAFRVLKPGGRLVLDLTDGDYMRSNFAEKSWEWMDHGSFVCRERQLSSDGKRLTSREIITQTDKGVLRDQFYQERLYSRAELFEIIRKSGFIVGHKDLGAVVNTIGQEMSKRNEDLGMMAQRMLVHAEKPCLSSSGNDTAFQASPSMQSQLVHRLPKFSILLGDPSKPCFGKLNNSWNPEDIETRNRLKNAVFALGYGENDIVFLESHDQLHQTLASNRPSFVFNLCDEGFFNDALMELHVPAMLDMLHIPYSGAGPNCLAYCYDKGLVNRTAAAIGIPTPRETFYLGSDGDLNVLHSAIVDSIGYPAFVKPIKGDNSLGITTRSIVKSAAELDSYINELKTIGISDIIVQEYLQGTEYSVGMVGNLDTGFHFFPIVEVDYSKILAKKLPPILGYESKWDPLSPYWTDISYEAAKLPDMVVEQLQRHCIKLWERFQCRDYARFDFRTDQGKGDLVDGSRGQIKLLEVNPNPGWCWDGKFAYMGKLVGKDYPQVLEMILMAAEKRVHFVAPAS